MNDQDTDENPKEAEERLRSRAADAFRYERPDAAQRPATETFDMSPQDQEAVENAKKELEERAKEHFRLPR